MPNTQQKPQTVVIEDAFGNIITMANGKIMIRSVGVLEIAAPVITEWTRRNPEQQPDLAKAIVESHPSRIAKGGPPEG
jgi:hypothetical protein